MIEKQLRQAENDVTVVGLVKQNNLELATTTTGKECLRGHLVVEIDTNYEVRVDFFTMKLTKNGTVNIVYKQLAEKINNIQPVSLVGIENASKVRISKAKLEENAYKSKDGQFHLGYRVKGTYVEIVDKNTENKAQYKIEGVVKNTKTIMSKDGTQKLGVGLTLYVPQFGNVLEEVSPFVCRTPQGMAYLENTYKKGQTVKIWGSVVKHLEITKKISKSEFGEDFVEEFEKRINELSIVGATAPYIGNKAYDLQVVKEGIDKLKIRHQEIQNAVKEKPSQNNNNGFGGDNFGGGSNSLDDEDIPF